MFRGVNQLRAIIASCAALVLSAVAPVYAQTVTNTANLQWDVGTTTVVRQSNRVEIPVERPLTTLSLSTFQISNDPGATLLPVPETVCRGTGGDIPVTLEGAFANTARNPASVEATTRIREIGRASCRERVCMLV